MVHPVRTSIGTRLICSRHVDIYMKITVDVDKLKADIYTAQEQYEKDYVKLLILYNKKLAEYSTYVDRYVTEHKTSTFKYPPSRPSHVIDAFVKNLAAFNAHTLPVIYPNST